MGVVCDGIAGIFKCTRENEAFYLKTRKSLAKFCIRNGCPFVPAYRCACVSLSRSVSVCLSSPLRSRKSFAKFCIRNGCPFVPAYSVGNSQAFNSWFDRYGFLEWLSRKTQTSLFLYWGRFLLPIPFRTNVTLLFGAPVPVEKKENPTEEEVDMVHQEMLDAFVKLFDTHKHALGWSHRELKII